MILLRFFFLLTLILGWMQDAAADAPERIRHFTFADLPNKPALRLLVTEGAPPLNFGLRADEKVTKAVFKVKYRFSPLLTPAESHIRVLLNGETISTLPMTRESSGGTATRNIELDPSSLTRYNSLTLEFVGNYAGAECQDPLHSNLWADIDKSSEVELTVQPTEIKSDLALLPEPFFDPADSGHARIPFVFAARPSYPTLKAAGIAASWFGLLAEWRHVRLPVYLDALPAGHAVVFATNSERPRFLAGLPAFSRPALSILPHPDDSHAKLLLVSGRDSADLAVAAKALALGTATLSGMRADIQAAGEETPRKPYDAPRWIPTDRPVKFGELITSPQQLQVYGHVPPPVKINLRIPPDLFTWRSKGVPVDLKFRYTPPVRTADSVLSMRANGELVQSVNLRSSGQGGESARVILPLLDSGLLGDSREMLIPAFKLGSRNQLEYVFRFSYLTAGACKDTQVENIQAMVDADSRIDFSGHPHYAEMPHLGYFATSGFPFTRYADLSQSVVVMPKAMDAKDMEVMLALFARMGESTGYPAIRAEVAGPDNDAAFMNRDLLLVGAAGHQTLLERWQSKLPVHLAEAPETTGKSSFASRLWTHIGQVRNLMGSRKLVDGDKAQAALLAFESPLTKKRSVVAVTAVSTEGLEQLLDVLENDEVISRIHGSVVLIHDGVAESIVSGSTYKVGKLPFWTAVWFPLSSHPVLLAVMAALAVLIFAFALWRTLKAVAHRRLNGK